jgi:vitamin B12 transporter
MKKTRIALCAIFAALIFPLLPAAYADEPAKLPEEIITAEAEDEYEDKLLLSPGSVTVIKPQEMKGEQKSLPDLLKQVPGLHVIETKGRGAYTVATVRGSDASQVSVFVDGVLMNLGSEAAVDLSAIPVENVERIEVYRGYVPSRFGGAAMGGVINITTQKPKKAGGTLSFGAGSFGHYTAGIAYSTALGDGTLFAAANFDKSDGDFPYPNDNNTPYTPGDDYEAHRKNNSYENKDFLLKWHNKDWTVQASWKRNDRYLPYAAPGADKPDSFEGPQLDTRKWTLSAARRFDWGDADIGVRLEYLGQEKKYDDPYNVIGSWSQQHNVYKTKRFTAALDGAVPIGENHLLEFLWDYSDERLDTEGDVIESFGGISRHTRRTWNAQIQDTISIGKKDDFWITPIIRWNNAEDETKFSWGVALNKKFPGGVTVKATGGTYNRAPNMYELYGDGAFVLANTRLDWETGEQFDLGIEWRGTLFKEVKTRAEITGFYRDSDNMLVFIMSNPRYGRYENYRSARVTGVEFESNFSWRKWDLYAVATWMKARSKSDNYTYDKPLPNRPEFEAKVRLSRKVFKDDSGTIFVEAHHIGKNYYDTIGGVGWDKLTTFGMGLRWNINDRLRLIAGVNDIFDKAPETNLFAVRNGPTRMLWYPMQGRTFYATLLWEF